MAHYEFDHVVIGGGCIGSSILSALTKIEAGSLALIDIGRKTTSATASSGGMLRVFHENPEHVKLALANYHLLQKNYKSCVKPNGSLYFFNPSRFAGHQASLALMAADNYPYEVLTRAQGAERFPYFHWQENEWAIYEPLGTHLDPAAFVEQMLSDSVQRGATLLEPFEVQRICPYLDRYRICCDEGTVTAKSLVLAGGARLIPRLYDLGLTLPLEVKTIKSRVGKKMDSDLILPNFFDRETLDFARLGPGPEVILSAVKTQRIKSPITTGSFEEKEAVDCYAPNRQGFIGVIPGHPRLTLATGWGGTAFKFALEVGQRVARGKEYYA
jgi:glycine/D-amino acid oxidase-like deaminating enzyme